MSICPHRTHELLDIFRHIVNDFIGARGLLQQLHDWMPTADATQTARYNALLDAIAARWPGRFDQFDEAARDELSYDARLRLASVCERLDGAKGFTTQRTLYDDALNWIQRHGIGGSACCPVMRSHLAFSVGRVAPPGPLSRVNYILCLELDAWRLSGRDPAEIEAAMGAVARCASGWEATLREQRRLEKEAAAMRRRADYRAWYAASTGLDPALYPSP